jgi:hypothetical protein
MNSIENNGRGMNKLFFLAFAVLVALFTGTGARAAEENLPT